MRFIDNSRLMPSFNWLNLANHASVELRNSTNRSDFLDDKVSFVFTSSETNRTKKYVASEVWKMLREEMIYLVYPTRNQLEPQLKCWYNESFETIEIFVDHFRPKGEISKLTLKNADLEDVFLMQIDADSRKGYWFLAFDYLNFRLACKAANQMLHPLPKPENSKAKGKSAFFPLHKDSSVAILAGGITHEKIVFLDPCIQSDTELLRFNEIGQALPSYSDFLWQHCRAIFSIEIYALNHHTYLRKGRMNIWKRTETLIKELDEAISIIPNRIKADEKKEELKKMIAKSSEFSAVAIDCIRYHKQTYSWLNIIFPPHKLQK